MFQKKEFPYLFTLIIGLIAWTVDQINTEFLKSKAIKYTVNYTEKTYKGPLLDFNNKSLPVAIFEFTNLTNDHLFKDIKFRFKLERKAGEDYDNSENEILLYDVRAVPPAYYEDPNQDSVLERDCQVEVPGLHPRRKSKVYIFYKGNNKPKVLLEYNAKTGTNTKNPILLMKGNVSSYVMENKLMIYFFLLIIWVSLVGIYLKKVPIKNE